MDVSVIIVNYNTCSLTQDCIASVLKKTQGIEFEIIVVDNNSKDNSIEIFSKDSRIHFIETHENLGFGRANNLGVSVAKGKFVFLLNSDTLLLDNAIKDLYDFYKTLSQNLKIGAVGSVLFSKEQKEIKSKIFFASISSLVLNFCKKLLFRYCKRPYSFGNPSSGYMHVDGVIGADMFIPVAVFKELGGFDPDFFLYGEEAEFQKRMKNAGYERFLIRGPRIIHLEGGSDHRNGKSMSAYTHYHLLRGQLLFVKKHKSPFYFVLYKIILLLTGYSFVLWNKKYSIVQKKEMFQLLLNLKRSDVF